ncbi:MAG: Gfo/Idh/MocA family oxidoreductase [Candidatus Melainabacteria bacterium]|nr:Gfo/Idh/MocA family oxidoreductase [Candidatus Melainabacteria bacterium]
MKKIVTIGTGLIGKERLKAFKLLKDLGRPIELAGIYDPYNKEIENIASEYTTKAFSNIEDLISASADFYFVATPHDVAIDIVEKLLASGKKVLLEKPLGRSVSEANKLVSASKYPGQLWVGFNYRFFDGIMEALKDLKRGYFGSLISINFILGHGGEPEMKNSWKLDPIRAGGGCLFDPGIHLLDICNLIAKMTNNNLEVKGSVSWSGFWNTGIEEECHLLLKANNFVINLQVSIVKWRSMFTLEINGTDAYGIVTGRNRSYGNQKYIRGKRWGWLKHKNQKDSEELVSETDGNDVFSKEMDALVFQNDQLFIKPCSSEEALENMKLWERCLKTLERN